MFDYIMEEVRKLSEQELEDSRERYEESFHSLHEGYGVIAEEMMEAEGEGKECRDNFDELLFFIHHRIAEDAVLFKIEMAALKAAAEYIQVAAMARKMLVNIDPKKTEV